MAYFFKHSDNFNFYLIIKQAVGSNIVLKGTTTSMVTYATREAFRLQV
jgi:hypothetical protein